MWCWRGCSGSSSPIWRILAPAPHPGGPSAPPHGRTSSRTPSASHFARASRCCIPSGVRSPACSAIVQQFLRGSSASSPHTNALARRRVSTLRKRAPIRVISSSKPTSHRPGSTLSPAATARSACVVTNHDDQPVAAPPLRRSGWSLTSAWAAAVAAVVMCASADRVPRRQRTGAAPAPLLTRSCSRTPAPGRRPGARRARRSCPARRRTPSGAAGTRAGRAGPGWRPARPG